MPGEYMQLGDIVKPKNTYQITFVGSATKYSVSQLGALTFSQFQIGSTPTVGSFGAMQQDRIRKQIEAKIPEIQEKLAQYGLTLNGVTAIIESDRQEIIVSFTAQEKATPVTFEIVTTIILAVLAVIGLGLITKIVEQVTEVGGQTATILLVVTILAAIVTIFVGLFGKRRK